MGYHAHEHDHQLHTKNFIPSSPKSENMFLKKQLFRICIFGHRVPLLFISQPDWSMVKQKQKTSQKVKSIKNSVINSKDNFGMRHRMYKI